MTEKQITEISRRLGRVAKKKRVEIVTAESCTGGLVAAAITRVSGSAKYFDRGFVTYSNDAKKQLLGVTQRSLGNHGAVSEQVAREMAAGALKASGADLSVSITGIAGPTGGSRSKPVGTVWFAWGVRKGEIQARHFRFKGDRFAIQRQAVAVALQGLIDLVR